MSNSNHSESFEVGSPVAYKKSLTSAAQWLNKLKSQED